MSKTLTTKEFIAKDSFLDKPVKIIGEYVNCKTKIKCKCLICNNLFEMTPDCLMQGQIHKPCAMKLAGAKRLSNTESFKKKLEKKNSNLEVIGNYINAKEKIDIMCKKCGYYFKSSPNNLLNGNGCPNCSKHIVRSLDDLYNQIENNTKNNVEILSPISSSNKKVEVKCNICMYEWQSTPISLIRYGCPNCEKNKRTKSNEDFTNELYIINPNIKLISKYKGLHSKVKCECLNDGHIWEADPSNLLKGTGCPICKESKGERKCRLFFERNDIDFIQQKSFEGLVGLNNGLLRYDFYLPSYNLLIEYQGEFHDGKSNNFVKSFYNRQHEHDIRKRAYAKENNIDLLEIWYWDFKNIEEILSKELGLIS